MRKSSESTFSIEQLFQDIRAALPNDVRVASYTNPYSSRGIWRRILGMVLARWHQGDVNHITGDVHFLGIFLQRRKTVLTIHDCVSLERITGVKYQLFKLFWYWLPSKRASAITVISEATKTELLRHLGRGSWPITVIPNFVAPTFEFSQKRFCNDYPVILQIGTKTNKNIERVAAALRGVSCKLVIVGKLSPIQIKLLKENQIDYENHFGISRDSLIIHYRNCDIVMFASLYEGFGLPILEAQATGRPVITSNLFSMPEVGGRGACYVDPYSVDGIRAAVERLMSDVTYRDELVTEGLSNATKYQLTNIAEQYAELYRRVHSEAVA